jgi:Xaa-Pro dipeptidase
VPASAVDAAARAVIEAAGYGRFALHRVGHGIGVSRHEDPDLRFDNDEPLRAGMALTIEPGFHVPGLGGFRHADTVVVTEDGVDAATPPASAPAPPAPLG